MKSKLLLLLKTNFLNTYKIKSSSKKKKFALLFLIIYVIIAIFTSLGMFFTSLFKSLNTVGMENYFITIIFAVASLFSFFFTIFTAKSALFENKDNNLLLSLPVKKNDIFASRILMLTIYNFVLGLAIIIPGLIVYFRNVDVSFIYLISIILLLVFFPIIPTILSSLFGYLVASLTSKTRKKSMFELIYYTLFIGIYMIIMTNGNKLLTSITDNPVILNNIMKYLFFPIYLVFKSLSTGNILYLLGIIIINVGVLSIFVRLLGKNYFKVISRLGKFKTTSNYKMKSIHSKSIKKALIEKEFKRYFSSAIYVFNTIFGVFIIAVASIASLFYSPEVLSSLIGESSMSSFSLVYMALIFVISLTVTTNSSISIERENMWIMKMIPVSTKDVFNAKTFLNRIILIPVAVLSLFLFFLSGYITLTEMALLLIFTVIYNAFISNYGLISNLLFPKLDAASDAVIVKQSAASLMGIMGGVAIFGIISGVVMSMNVNNITLLLISIAFSTVIYVISKIILNTWGVKKYKTIN